MSLFDIIPESSDTADFIAEDQGTSSDVYQDWCGKAVLPVRGCVTLRAATPLISSGCSQTQPAPSSIKPPEKPPSTQTRDREHTEQPTSASKVTCDDDEAMDDVLTEIEAFLNSGAVVITDD
jgi:hypothetical protein